MAPPSIPDRDIRTVAKELVSKRIDEHLSKLRTIAEPYDLTALAAVIEGLLLRVERRSSSKRKRAS